VSTGTQLTRGGFLKRTSVGAAALGALAVPGLADHMVAAAHAAEASRTSQRGPLVAYVRDVASGEVALLVGTREVVVRDPELVARLVRAAR
jgi:hypothetical protein